MEKRIFIILVFFISIHETRAQTFDECHFTSAMYINADNPPQFKGSLQRYFEKELTGKYEKLKGMIFLQIMIDSLGKTCCASIINKTNSDIRSLELRAAVDRMPNWKPAVNNKHTVNFSASLRLQFENAKMKVIYDSILTVVSPFENENTNSTNKPYTITDKTNNSVWKLWTTTNSVIPKNISRVVTMDTSGIIWYCTDGGIVKIDGENWKVYSGKNISALSGKVGNTFTNYMAIDKNSNVWIASFGEVVKFDGEQWTKYDTSNSPLKSVSEISVDRNGIIWFGTIKGLVKYDGKNWTTYSTKNSKIATDYVNQVYVDSSGTCWIASKKGLIKFKDDNWTTFTTENSALPNNDVSTIQGDSQGNIWAGTSGNGQNALVKIDADGNWSSYPADVIWKITIDEATQHVWLATNGGGLAIFDGQTFHHFNSSNSILPNNTVSSILIDKNGDKWLATFGGLVFTTLK